MRISCSLSFHLTASLAPLSGCLADPMIGFCNVTYFIAGGQKCQRTMMSNLKHKSNGDCSFEYQHQTSCLTEHLSSCLSGPLFASFVPQVTSLIKLLFYHCGDLVVDPAAIDQFLLNQIQCKAEVFTKIVRCWDDFRNRLNTNKADLQLCRDYAMAKQCVTQEAKAGCGIGQYINRDMFNPFCSYNTDPPLDTAEPIVYIGRCSTKNFAFSVYTCQREMITNLAKDDGGSCREEYAKLQLCLSFTMEACFTRTSLSVFQDQVRQLVQSLLYHCGSLSVDKLSINSFLLSALNCNKTMFHTAVQCWDQFRLKLIINKFDKQLCVDYTISKRCALRTVQRGCVIGDLMEEDIYNPFCVHGVDPLTLPSISDVSVPTPSPFKFVCKNDFFYTKAVTCENEFLRAIYSTRIVTNCRAQSQSFLSCLKTNFESCVRPQSNQLLLEALGLVVLQSLQGTELLCESPIKPILWGNLPPLLQTVASCSKDYTDELIHCGRLFRSKFIPVPSPLCEEFESARKCVDEARKSFCLFDNQSRMTLKGNFNPFCDNRTKPLFTDGGDRLRAIFKLEIILFLSLSFSNFT